MNAYQPGEQPADAHALKLNTNENPYPPAEAVLAAIRETPAEALRRYPAPRADGFRSAAAERHEVAPEQVIAANGGDELLRLAVTVFCEPRGGGIAETEPTYSLYDVLAAIHETPATRVPLAADWALPEDFVDRAHEAGARLALVVSPHAPSGRLEPPERLRRVAEAFEGVLLVDEAYHDFAEPDAGDGAVSLVRGPDALPNVLVLRSLSKGHGLAGLRFGYGVGPPALIGALDKARDSYNVDAVAQRAAEAALRHRADSEEARDTVRRERDRLREALRDRGWSVPPSAANFLFARPPAGAAEAEAVFDALRDRAIYVRWFEGKRTRDHVRITVGTPAQNERLLAALDQIAAPAEKR